MDLVLRVSGLLRNPYKLASDLLSLIRSGKLTVELLDISPSGDAGRLRTVRWIVALLSARSKAPDFEAVFAELRTLCWNLLYAFVRHLGASGGELGP